MKAKTKETTFRSDLDQIQQIIVSRKIIKLGLPFKETLILSLIFFEDEVDYTNEEFAYFLNDRKLECSNAIVNLIAKGYVKRRYTQWKKKDLKRYKRSKKRKRILNLNHNFINQKIYEGKNE